MKIIEKKLSELNPYENNPRKNDGAVEYVANSIKEFGIKIPLVIDKNSCIVCGHTRYKACEKLGIKTVPCIIADDLTPEQIKKFRIVDNSVADKAKWDFELLKAEVFSIPEFEFEMPKFNIHIPEERAYYGDERERTANAYKLWEFDPKRAAGKYQIPIIKACDYVPTELIGFNYMLTSERYDAGIHFFIDDYQFERIWNNPKKYIDKLRRFSCMLTPDFSLYMNMPLAMKIWNLFRSRMIGQMAQDAGVTVLPTLSWAGPETFDFCFDGIESGGTVAVSTVGIVKGAQKEWGNGMKEAIKRVCPSNILCYGAKVDFDFGDIPVTYFEARKFNDKQK